MKSACCENCFSPFSQTKTWQRFCSVACRIEWHKDNDVTSTVEPFYAMTQEQVAERLGISRAHVQRIEQGALKKLRRALKTLGINEVSI